MIEDTRFPVPLGEGVVAVSRFGTRGGQSDWKADLATGTSFGNGRLQRGVFLKQ